MQLLTNLTPLHSLHPGEWYFGGDYERLHTVLGSCVALTTWHPKFKVGGLCHYLLPTAPKRNGVKLLDCRYAENALAQMKKSMLTCAALGEFQVGIFGGGDMFSYHTPRSIGFENIAYARQWLMREKIRPYKVEVGGTLSRSLIMILTTGEIQVKRYQMKV